jgi:hypothetical protein
MRTPTRTALALAAAATLLTLTAAAACDNRPAEEIELPIDVVEQADGDCDLGDLYERTPDPDCGGRWYGTPAPRRTTAVPQPVRTATGAARPTPVKPPAPATKTTRR